MPVTSHYSKDEIKAIRESITDKDVAQLLDDINKLNETKYVIQEQKFICKSFFKKETKTVYRLLCYVNDVEWQIFNFPTDEKENKINLETSRAVIIAYLLGFLNGHESK